MVGSEGSGGPSTTATGVMRAWLWARACRTGSREHRRERWTVRRAGRMPDASCQDARWRPELGEGEAGVKMNGGN